MRFNPKNPVLGAFFREIDRADELGSGMRNLMLYGKKYGGADPQLIEGDIFRMVISVPEFGELSADAPKQVLVEGSGKASVKTSVKFWIPYGTTPISRFRKLQR